MTDALGKVRTAVDRDDARFVGELHVQNHESGRLQNLRIAERPRRVRAAEPRRAVREAAHEVAEILRPVGRGGGRRRDRRSPPPLSLGCPRNLPVRWIDDQRRAVVEYPFNQIFSAAGRIGILVDLGIGVRGKEEIVAGRGVGLSIAEDSIGTRLQFLDFFVGEKWFACQRRGPLERRRTVREPNTLEIGVAVRRAWRLTSAALTPPSGTRGRPLG